MLPASLAFLWIAWRQHRWGLLVVLSGLLLAATLSAIVPWLCPRHLAEITFGLVILPLVSVTIYPLVIFTYGFDAGDVLARESCFPTGLLRLPLRTRTLVLWPIALGAATAFLMWLATSFFIFRPWLGNFELGISENAAPLWWPSMMAVAILAWFQALFWMPFGLPWLRAILVLLFVQGMIAAPLCAAAVGVPERWLVGLFAGLAVSGWIVSCVGVRLARRGDVPNWEWMLAALGQRLYGKPRHPQPFASAARAQLWFEWRLTGKTLPIVTGFLLPIALMPVSVSDVDNNAVGMSLLCTVAVPVLFAGVAGWLGSRRSRWAQGRAGMMPFVATLPMTTADMVGAILKTAAWATLATAAVIVVVWPSAVVLTGSLPQVARWWQHDMDVRIVLRIAALVTVITVVLLVWTWKRKLDRLYVGLIGSKWIEAAVAWGSIPMTYFMCVFVFTIYAEPLAHYAITLAVWPWFLGVLILFRLLTAAWALQKVLRQGLLQMRTAACWIAAWLLLAAALFALLDWAAPTNLLTAYDLGCGVAFALPMVRLAAAPLGLAWNRHR